MILIDTSPLVALFDPKDADHKDCHTVLNDITEPLYTTEAVLTEALHMLDPASKGSARLKDFFLEDYVTLVPLDKPMILRCFTLMETYLDLPMDFADSTLVILAEQYKTKKVFTLDFNDFRTYRVLKGHRHYPLELIGADILE